MREAAVSDAETLGELQNRYNQLRILREVGLILDEPSLDAEVLQPLKALLIARANAPRIRHVSVTDPGEFPPRHATLYY